MPKKLVKKVAEEIVKEPKRVVEEAARQVGAFPSPEPEPELTREQLEEKRKKDEAMRRKRLAEIQAEMKQVVEERKTARTQAREAEELKKKEEEKKPVKPLEQPRAKKPRRLWMGLQKRLEKFLPEKVARRVSG